ncbi:hypothetical protein [Hydrogenophaga sp.]|uniref:hypothetical protein n=1 Tax=Hydrogenophaga sp. TaxID=1904254 RepID=UPI003F6EEAB4
MERVLKFQPIRFSKEAGMGEVYREDVWFDAMGGRARDHRAIASHERPPKPTRVRAPRALRRPAMTPGDVLRHVMLNDPASALACADARGLRHLNEQMLTILEACHRVDTARRQLLNTLKAKKTLESVSHILAARVEAGLSECLEQRKLALRLADARRSVTEAIGAWDGASKQFSRLTRLLPAQLGALPEGFEPVDPAEIDRLADASALNCPQTQDCLRQLARERARRRGSPAVWTGPSPDDLSAWVLRLHQARDEAIGRFSAARETYLQAVMDCGLAQARVAQACDARRLAEAGFRIGARGALEFAAAVCDQSRLCNELLGFAAQACTARHGLYAMALLLPEQFDLR